jgi:hypothetical protein
MEVGLINLWWEGLPRAEEGRKRAGTKKHSVRVDSSLFELIIQMEFIHSPEISTDSELERMIMNPDLEFCGNPDGEDEERGDEQDPSFEGFRFFPPDLDAVEEEAEREREGIDGDGGDGDLQLSQSSLSQRTTSLRRKYENGEVISGEEEEGLREPLLSEGEEKGEGGTQKMEVDGTCTGLSSSSSINTLSTLTNESSQNTNGTPLLQRIVQKEQDILLSAQFDFPEIRGKYRIIEKIGEGTRLYSLSSPPPHSALFTSRLIYMFFSSTFPFVLLHIKLFVGSYSLVYRAVSLRNPNIVVALKRIVPLSSPARIANEVRHLKNLG